MMASVGAMDFHEWLAHGVEQRWISMPVCDTHDGIPMRIWEAEAWEEGSDPCIAVMRLWNDGMPDDDEVEGIVT